MKETKIEAVTRVYCDVCGDDITNASRIGDTNSDGTRADICMDYGNPSCHEKWKFARDFISGDNSFR
jgi:hypothetical protein